MAGLRNRELRLSMIPLSGYVKMRGDDDVASTHQIITKCPR